MLPAYLKTSYTYDTIDENNKKNHAISTTYLCCVQSIHEDKWGILFMYINRLEMKWFFNNKAQRDTEFNRVTGMM